MEADYVVVGAGSAGCALAARLSEDPSVSVILLEAGGKDRNPWIHIPVGYFKTMHNPSVDWRYMTEPEPGLNGRRLEWPRGKVLGGSSSLNGLLYIRGQQQDYDGWRQMGATGWSFEDVLPYFRKSEDQERGGDEWHGEGGPLGVSDMRVKRGVSEQFIEAAAEAGLPKTDDFNGAEQEGVGYFQLTSRKGLRCSSAAAYLKPARARANLRVVTHAATQRVLFEGRKAIGVEALVNGTPTTISARREIILSAGAIGSPQILQLSGVGPGALLNEHGVDVVHESPGVGEDLQDHLQIRSVYEVSEPTLNDEVNNFFRRMAIGVRYILFRDGPMSMGASQVGAFATVDPTSASPDIQFHMQPLSSESPGHGLDKFSAFTSSVCQLRPESRGTVRIKSPDAADHPAIVANYLTAEKDCRIAVSGLKFSRKIAESPALARIITREREPGDEAQTDEEILEWIRNRATTIYHPTSTCRMGTDRMAVVDPHLRVRGLSGLRIADASIMPTITSGNTNAPAIMIGEKAADLILEDAG